tara:strand:- start:346 stop:552 length:207 start_codon:yes stop_codon:yes gene_type:complete
MDKQQYKDKMGELMSENSKLKERIKELETQLYFITRNNKIDEMVDDRDISNKQRNLFDNSEQLGVFDE